MMDDDDWNIIYSLQPPPPPHSKIINLFNFRYFFTLLCHDANCFLAQLKYKLDLPICEPNQISRLELQFASQYHFSRDVTQLTVGSGFSKQIKHCKDCYS